MSNLPIQINTIFKFTANYSHDVKMCGTKQQQKNERANEQVRDDEDISLSNMKIMNEKERIKWTNK